MKTAKCTRSGGDVISSTGANRNNCRNREIDFPNKKLSDNHITTMRAGAGLNIQLCNIIIIITIIDPEVMHMYTCM